MHVNILETERLVLRRFSLRDNNFIIKLLNTVGWIRFIGDRNVKNIIQAKHYLDNGPLKMYRNGEFGLNLVSLKQTNTSIGMCGLLKRDYLEQNDIGFAFLPEHAGKGYGYEIASAVMQYAFDAMQKQALAAITLPENAASIKLIEKLGFLYSNNFITADTRETLSLYTATKDSFEKRNSTRVVA